MKLFEFVFIAIKVNVKILYSLLICSNCNKINKINNFVFVLKKQVKCRKIFRNIIRVENKPFKMKLILSSRNYFHFKIEHINDIIAIDETDFYCFITI